MSSIFPSPEPHEGQHQKEQRTLSMIRIDTHLIKVDTLPSPGAEAERAAEPDLPDLIPILVDQLRHGVVLFLVTAATPYTAAARCGTPCEAAQGGASAEPRALDERCHPQARVRDLKVCWRPNALRIAEPTYHMLYIM